MFDLSLGEYLIVAGLCLPGVAVILFIAAKIEMAIRQHVQTAFWFGISMLTLQVSVVFAIGGMTWIVCLLYLPQPASVG